MAAVVLYPLAASASVFSVFAGNTAQADTVIPATTAETPAIVGSQEVALDSSSVVGPGTLSGIVTGGADPSTVITDAALTPTMGPVGNASDVNTLESAAAGGITFYTVQSGDTASSVAQMFGISTGTLLSANSLKSGDAIKVGTNLVILPVGGTTYTIKAGDTVKSIASATGANIADLYFYNDLTPDSVLNVGDTIIVPDSGTDETGDAPAAAPTKAPVKKPATPATSSGKSTKTTKTTTKPSSGTSSKKVPMTASGLLTTNYNGTNNTPITVHPAKLTAKVDLSGQLCLPIDPNVGELSQGYHGWDMSAVDIAAPLGTPIHAIADGTVLLAREGGYNDGYGDYMILMSEVGGIPLQSIYGHMSEVLVSSGQTVSKGDVIGYVGRTGDATGDHLHVEVRGAQNPFINDYRRQ